MCLGERDERRPMLGEIRGSLAKENKQVRQASEVIVICTLESFSFHLFLAPTDLASRYFRASRLRGGYPLSS